MRVLSSGMIAFLGLALASTAMAQTSTKSPTGGSAATKSGLPSPGTVAPTSSGGMIFVNTNDCSAPTPISGTGSHPFNTTSATTSFFDGGGTCPSGSDSINQDIFWQWTATAPGNYQFDTFGSGFDTKLSVHAGVGCAATCVGYNDDTGGLQSRVIVGQVNSGDTFVIQVGGYSTASGSGVLNISTFVDPCYDHDQFEPNDSCAQAVPIGDGTYPGLTVYKTNSDFYEVTVADGDTLTVDILFSHAVADVDIFLYDPFNCQDGHVGTTGSLASGYSVTNNESISWANTTGSAQTYKIKVNVYPFSSGDCNTYDMIVTGAGAGGIATSFCAGDGTASPCPCGNTGLPGRGCNNGTGAGGSLLSAAGDVVVGSGNLVLMGEGLEPTSPGLYYQGNNAVNGGMGLAFGDGLRCVGGGVIRIQVRMSNANGQSSTTIDVAAKGGVVPGDLRRYQLWYRNANFTLCGSGFNLSNGLEIVWQ